MSYLLAHCSLCEMTEPVTVENFTCGDQDLDDFFSNDCFGYAKQLLGKTYCYRLDENPDKIVCAFTLANASIRVSDLPNARKKRIESDIPHAKSLKDYPAVLVGRLGVSREFLESRYVSQHKIDVFRPADDSSLRVRCVFPLADQVEGCK